MCRRHLVEIKIVEVEGPSSGSKSRYAGDGRGEHQHLTGSTKLGSEMRAGWMRKLRRSS